MSKWAEMPASATLRSITPWLYPLLHDDPCSMTTMPALPSIGPNAIAISVGNVRREDA